MNRKEVLKNKEEANLFEQIIALHNSLDNAFLQQFNRSLPFSENLIDRWERAEKLGFGKGTSIYDSSMVLGNVKVGQSCWIGPNTIIDGSGDLTIGNHCTISAGVQIYTHDNVKQTLSSGKLPIERNPVKIGNNVYLGPNAIIVKGIKIGNYSVIGAGAYVNKEVPDYTVVVGQPARAIGKVQIKGDTITINYF